MRSEVIRWNCNAHEPLSLFHHRMGKHGEDETLLRGVYYGNLFAPKIAYLGENLPLGYIRRHIDIRFTETACWGLKSYAAIHDDGSTRRKYRSALDHPKMLCYV